MALLAVAILATAAGMRAMRGSPRGQRVHRRMLRSWVFGIDARARRRFGPYCRVWMPPTWTAASAHTSPRWLSRSPPPATRCWRWRWMARRCEEHAAPERRRSMWCRCSPITPGWCSGSSPSRTRATKYPASVRCSNCSGTSGSWWHHRRNAYPERKHRKVDLQHPEIPLPDDGEVDSRRPLVLISRPCRGRRCQLPSPSRQTPATAALKHSTLKTLTASRGIGFPYAKQIAEVTRERVVTATREVLFDPHCLCHLQCCVRIGPTQNGWPS